MALGNAKAVLGMRSGKGILVAAWTCLLLLLSEETSLAHAGEPPAPHDLWTSWNWDPLIVLAIGLLGTLYFRGLRRLWARAGSGHGASRLQVAAFYGGLLALVIALVSPLDALGTALFSAHMVQHLALVLIAAPLLVLGKPHIVLLWALNRSQRRAVGRLSHRKPVKMLSRAFTRPFTAWVLFGATLWIWHAPVLYEAALRSDLVHALEHGCFLAVSLLFWWTLLHSEGRSRLAYGTTALYVFTTALHNTALGMLLTFSEQIWYPIYLPRVEPWGLTPLQDQQLAGLIMWIPPGVVYLLVIGTTLVLWLNAMESRMQSKSRWSDNLVMPDAEPETNQNELQANQSR